MTDGEGQAAINQKAGSMIEEEKKLALIRPAKPRLMLTPSSEDNKNADPMAFSPLSDDHSSPSTRGRGDSMFERGKRPDIRTRRASQLFDPTRRPSKMRSLDGKEPDLGKARLWQAFNELEWKDESERKYVFQSYENLKTAYMKTHMEKQAALAAEHPPVRPREDSAIILAQGLAKIREEHRAKVQKSLTAASAKQSGYTYAHLPILKPRMPMTLSYITTMIEEFRMGHICHEATMYEILARTIDAQKTLPNIVRLKINEGCNLTICGDIHGQLEDFLTIFELNGLPSEQNQYLFNGDFVDRGPHSCEVMLLMFAFKLLFPTAMHLNRGNHEARDMNVQHGFEQEVLAKYTTGAFDTFCQAFSVLPIACLIEEKILVIHGGCSWQDDITLEDISAIDRFHEVVPEDTLFEDLLWADPCADEGRFESDRGCGLSFGPDVCRNFLQANNLDCLIRSHECVDKGYEEWFDGALITIFSASNYCGMAGNHGAIIVMGPDLKPKYVSYFATPLDQLVSQSIDRAHLENGVISKLFARICAARLALMDYFRQRVVAPNSRVISRKDWAAGMVSVLGLDIDFLSFGPLLGLPTHGVDGKEGGDINYVSYLARFRPIHRGSGSAPGAPMEAEDDEDEETAVSKDVSQMPLSGDGGPQRRKKAMDEATRLLSEINTLMFTHRYELESLFRFFDLDGTGIITADELRDGLTSLGQVIGKTLTPKQIDSAVSLIDRENHGSVNYQAFFQGFRAAGFSTENQMMSANVMMDRKERQDCIDLANDIISSLTAQLGCQLVWSKAGVAKLTGVTPGMAGAEAGLLEGDLILSIDDNSIGDRNAFRAAMLNARIGECLNFSIERAQRRFVVPVTILGTGKSLEEIEVLKRISSGVVFPPDLVWYRQQIKDRLVQHSIATDTKLTTGTAPATSPGKATTTNKGTLGSAGKKTTSPPKSKVALKAPQSPTLKAKNSPSPTSPKSPKKANGPNTLAPPNLSLSYPPASPSSSANARGTDMGSLPASVAVSPKKFTRSGKGVQLEEVKAPGSPRLSPKAGPVATPRQTKGPAIASPTSGKKPGTKTYVKGGKLTSPEFPNAVAVAETPKEVKTASPTSPAPSPLSLPASVASAVPSLATLSAPTPTTTPISPSLGPAKRQPPPPPPLTEEVLQRFQHQQHQQ